MAEKENIKDKLENLKEGHRKSKSDANAQGGGNKRISRHQKYISQQNGKHGDSP